MPAPAAPAPAVEATAKSPGWTATLSPGDARLISQPRPLEGGVGLIGRLRPKRYLLHTGQLFGNGRVVLDADPIPTVGLIAQEAVPAVPEAVYPPVDDAKDFWLLDYTRLVPVLVRAVQEQQADLQSKDSRIQSLENQLGNLEAELAKLKEITRVIDDSARTAVAGLRSEIGNLASKVAALEGKTSCSCSNK
jgi:polyhydroxyalkanoate synthesis regulator phasin